MRDRDSDKHTPGPWSEESERYHGPDWAIIGSSQRDQWHAFARVVVRLDGQASKEGEANARLITASPDLLAVAELVVGSMTVGDDPVHAELRRRALAAIAKATGQQ